MTAHFVRCTAALFLVGAVALPQERSPDPPDRRTEPRIEWTDPPQGWPSPVRDTVRFGYLAVPVDHADPQGPTMRMALIVVPAWTPDKAPDPVVSIAGGPGLRALDLHMRTRAAGQHPSDIFRERRDLVVIDPRGHGYSDPPRCSELDGAVPRSVDSPEAERVWLGKLRACRERLLAQGVRLETLSAVQAAHDLEILRRALGAPQLNLMGLSYGSRIAGEAVRQIPEAIRAVYYRGPLPPRHFPKREDEIADAVLPALFERCAATSHCRAAFPNLPEDYASLIARLDRAPVPVPVPPSDTLPEGELVADGQAMRGGLLELLLNRERAAGLPLLIHTLADKGVEPVRRMAAPMMGALSDPGSSTGTWLAFRCNDGLASGPPAWLLRWCRALLGDEWSDSGAEPIHSDVPGLIVAGEFDPRTPPPFARTLAAGLPRAHVVIEPWHGHEGPLDCMQRIAQAFFERPDAVPDGRCLDSVPPIAFVTNVASSRWTPRLVGWIWQSPWRAVVPGAALLLFLVPAVCLPIREIRARRRPAAGRLVTLALLGVSILGLALVIGLAAAVFLGMRRHIVVPLAGVSAEWGWVLALPWLLLALTAAALYLVVSRGSEAREVPAILRWSPLLGAGIVLAVWGFSAM